MRPHALFLSRPAQLVRAGVVLASIWLVGCAGLAPRPVVRESHALTDVAGTRLARLQAAAAPADASGLSGFRMLPEAPLAFNARIALARRAEKSIDAQYYLIHDDPIGQRFLLELRDAALRGVRVRLLVDDLYAGGKDELFAGLAAQPNVEVRIFNPLPIRSGGFLTRLVSSLHEFGRINHRMHNKLFVADNSFAVTGGRNIADEYFMRNEGNNFIDLDVLSSGPVVREFSAAFDRYWNSEQVYPLGVVLDAAVKAWPGEFARQRFDELVRNAAPPFDEPARDVLGSAPVAAQLDSGVLDQVFAPARVLADAPGKVGGVIDTQIEHTVTGQTLALFGQAQRSIEVVSPYFIPGSRGLALMRQATSTGTRITLVTNSESATDEPLVHERYARYRLGMLQAGVQIHEISPQLSERARRSSSSNLGLSPGRLHAKAAVIDERLMYIGSMNFDARSAVANTEVGLVIDSPELVRKVAKTLLGNLVGSGTYELRLTPNRERIEWLETGADGRVIVHADEPEADGWTRLKVWLMAPFVGEELL